MEDFIKYPLIAACIVFATVMMVSFFPWGKIIKYEIPIVYEVRARKGDGPILLTRRAINLWSREHDIKLKPNIREAMEYYITKEKPFLGKIYPTTIFRVHEGLIEEAYEEAIK